MFNTEKIDKIIVKNKKKPGELLLILEEVQKESQGKYLSVEVLEYIAESLRVPLSRIYSVVTFYSFFNLKAQAKHCVNVCRGTACHAKGSKNILKDAVAFLGIKEEFSESEEKVFLNSQDFNWTLRTVACVGQCASAPVVLVDEVMHPKMDSKKLKKIIEAVK